MDLFATTHVPTALAGGALIGLAAVWLLLALGRIAGISGIASKALSGGGAVSWQRLFVLGLGVGGWLALAATGFQPADQVTAIQAATLVLAGLLVGYGTRLGSGCTSGHGVCGSARLSKRSIIATGTFLAVGMAVATLVGVLA